MNFIRRYARFAAFLATALVAGGLLAIRFEPVTALLGGFDIGALVFIAALGLTLFSERVDDMRRRAGENESDQHVLSLLGGVVFIVVLVAVGHEIVNSRARDLLLSGATLMLAWVFGNLLFMMHYAHAYYLAQDGKDAGGLDFPGDAPPNYWDFTYFAFVLGMTFQVSDVEIETTGLRRAALLHGLLGFLFNIGVVALTVSILGNALK